TRITAGNVLHATQVVLGFEVISQDALVCKGSAVEVHRSQNRRLLVPHVEDFCPWTKKLFRCAMAVKAPLHLQRGMRVHHWHAVYGTMTVVAADPLVNVNAVIKENVVR